MSEKLSNFIEQLEGLKEAIDGADINAAGFARHGWSQVHLKKEDLSYYVGNHIGKLKSYDNEITEGLNSTIDGHIENIKALKGKVGSYFTDNANHLVTFVPVILLTLNTIFEDIEYELFSFENMQEKKLLPKGLAARLRSTKTQLDKIDESSESISSKITLINEAHEAAESLPTDLASLNEAKKELEQTIRASKKELADTKREVDELKNEVLGFKNDTQKYVEEVEKYRKQTHQSSEEAEKLVEQCDDALQITTTQGLAAGFDQKAKELRSSIWIWIFGLLIALVSGAWIGAERVDAFTAVLNNDLTAGQAILHTVMSIFSIGGPLWLAWISTKQINQRFKLAEDYSYKATVAKSFTGFKKFAERFDSSTEERLFNSTLDRFDEMPLRLVETKDHNSPWHEFTDSDAFKSAIDVVPSLAKEAGKFANKTSLKNRAMKNRSKEKKKIENENLEPEYEVEAE